MFPKELLEVKKRKGRIFPKFAGEEDFGLAEDVIQLFSESRGENLGQIKKKLKKIENSKNYRKVRAFARIIERNSESEFDIPSELDPVSIRDFLFTRGYVTSKKERETLFEEASSFFNTSKGLIEKYLFADREEEQILINVPEIKPDEMIRSYNLSLLQTAIFDSLRISFWTSSHHKDIFRRIKYLGLMYQIKNKEVKITGTASIIKMTKRYGTSMAKLIPIILKAEKWRIEAEILDTYSNRIFVMELDSSDSVLFPETCEEITFDSSLEEEFSRKLKSVKPGIEVIREPDVVEAGSYAFIPDFLVRKGEKEVFVEIAGFWTSDYIRKKMEKVKLAQIPLILIAREDYGIDSTSDDIILFSSKIPYNEVIKRINLELCSSIDEVEFEGDAVNLMEFSEEGISMPDLIKKAESEGYIVAGSVAVKKELFESIRRKVDEINPEDYSDVKPLLDDYGIPQDFLEKMGYRIVWAGLFEDDVKLERVL